MIDLNSLNAEADGVLRVKALAGPSLEVSSFPVGPGRSAQRSEQLTKACPARQQLNLIPNARGGLG